MATFVNDTFTDTDATNVTAHTPETGGSITEHSSHTAADADIRSNRARNTNTSEGVWYYGGSPASADYDVTVVIDCLSTANNRASVCFRIDTGADSYYFCQWQKAADAWQLFKVIAGVNTSLGSFSDTFTSGSKTEKVECRDAAKKIFIDGVERISSADNAITAAGKAGFRFNSTAAGTTTGYHITSITAADPASGAMTCIMDMAFGHGSTSLTGTGALASTNAMTFAGTPALTGSGELASNHILTFGASQTLIGNTSLASTCLIQFSGTGTLSNLGSGEIFSNHIMTFDAPGSLSGSGALASNHILTFAGTPPLTGTGTLSSTMPMTLDESGTLTGGGVLSASIPITIDVNAQASSTASIAATMPMTFTYTATPTTESGYLLFETTIYPTIDFDTSIEPSIDFESAIKPL